MEVNRAVIESEWEWVERGLRSVEQKIQEAEKSLLPVPEIAFWAEESHFKPHAFHQSVSHPNISESLDLGSHSSQVPTHITNSIVPSDSSENTSVATAQSSNTPAAITFETSHCSLAELDTEWDSILDDNFTARSQASDLATPIIFNELFDDSDQVLENTKTPPSESPSEEFSECKLARPCRIARNIRYYIVPPQVGD